MKQYQITKERCQAQIDKKPVVCSGCGGKIEPIDTVNNSGDPTYWAGCHKCMCFDNGVSQKVFDIAKYMVVHDRYVHYSHAQRPMKEEGEEWEYWVSEQVRGTSHMIARIIYLSENGIPDE